MGFDELKTLAAPYTDQSGGAIWDYWLYALLVVQFILLVLLFQGSLRDVILTAAAMIATVMDKLYIFGFMDPGSPAGDGDIVGAVQWHTLESFFTWGARILMFAAPLLIITQTKIGKAKPVAILLSLATVIYVFGRWAFQIRLDASSDTQKRGSLEETIYLAHSGAMLLMLLELHYHRWKMQQQE